MFEKKSGLSFISWSLGSKSIWKTIIDESVVPIIQRIKVKQFSSNFYYSKHNCANYIYKLNILYYINILYKYIL